MFLLLACHAPSERGAPDRSAEPPAARTCASDADADGVCDDVDACVGGDVGDTLCGSAASWIVRADTTSQSGPPAELGDLDGDGYDDFLSGDAATSAFFGEVRQYDGGLGGVDTAGYTTFSRPSGAGYFGFVVHGVGDVTGDGHDDVMVLGSTAGTTVAVGWLYEGNGAGLDPTPLSSVSGWHRSGQKVVGLGDLNGDGFDDVAIGSPYDDDARTLGRGTVRIYYGSAAGLADPATTTLSNNVAGLAFGASLAAPGDLDGDGYVDLLVGQPGTSAGGKVHLYRGGFTGMATTPSWTVSASTGAFGLGLTGTTDLDADGQTEVVIGNHYTSYVYVYEEASGTFPASPTQTLSAAAGSLFGSHLADVGDVDADGYGDLLVGAYGQSRAYLYRGGAGGLVLGATLSAPSGAGQFGALLSGVGDVNGDGARDVAIGDTTLDDVWIFHGVCAADSDHDSICDASDRAPGADDFEDSDGDGALDPDDPCPADPADDADADGACGDVDNCPVANADQADLDGDGQGDACDACPADPLDDADGDTRCAEVDNCPTLANDQADADTDGLGDACDPCPTDPGNDPDADGLCAADDNCPDDPNADQADADLDGRGDACDACAPGAEDGPDADGHCAAEDNCPATDNPGQEDADGDGAGDVCDACPADPSDDADADGLCADVDNCPVDANPGQDDGDGDGAGDSCDACPADPEDDADQDGSCGDVDCAPYHPLRAPGLAERVADGIDNDCDGLELCYEDADGDGWTSGSTVASSDGDCADAGEADVWTPDGDCDPEVAGVNPGATELVGDEVDGDCDGAELCLADLDGDGVSSGAVLSSDDPWCDEAGEATADAPVDDCDDGSPATAPGAPELVGDGVDEDCDGGEVCLADNDGDGYAGSTVASADADCADAGELGDDAPDGDCNDANPRYYPGASDTPGDGQDRDCSGGDGDFRDDDGDGWTSQYDCDEADPLAHPGAAERCNQADDNCDGQVDEGVKALQFLDVDGDGAGTVAEILSACPGSVSGYANTANDCDDADDRRVPGSPEVCDGLDNDCDGVVDEDPGLGCG